MGRVGATHGDVGCGYPHRARPRQGLDRARAPHRQEAARLQRRGSAELEGGPERGVQVSRSIVALLLSAAVGVALGVACAGGQTKKGVKDACTRNLDCAYGLECVDASGTAIASAEGADAGKAVARTCQWKSFGDCDVPEGAD